MKLELSDMERRNHEERYALALDADGYEIFVGLTREESMALLGHIRMNSLPVRSAGIRQEKEVQKRGIELRQKHENARLRVQWEKQGHDT